MAQLNERIHRKKEAGGLTARSSQLPQGLQLCNRLGQFGLSLCVIHVGFLVGEGSLGPLLRLHSSRLVDVFGIDAVVQGDREGLQKVVSAVTLWIFVPSVVIALTLFAFAKPVLSVFGPEFLEAEWALKILIVGQLIDVLCGSVGNLMVMIAGPTRTTATRTSIEALIQAYRRS